MLPAAAQAAWPVAGGSGVGVGYLQGYAGDAGANRVHHGIDCLAPAGSQVMAPVQGTVSFVGRVPSGEVAGSGTQLAVSVELPDGLTLTLMPFESVEVQPGQPVALGQQLGVLAASGDKSSPLPHVHVGLKRGSTYLDPSALLGLQPAAPAEGEQAVAVPADLAQQPIEAQPQEQPAVAQQPAPQEQSLPAELPEQVQAAQPVAPISSRTLQGTVPQVPLQHDGQQPGSAWGPLQPMVDALCSTAGNMGSMLASLLPNQETAWALLASMVAAMAALIMALSLRRRRRVHAENPGRTGRTPAALRTKRMTPAWARAARE